MNGWVCPSRLRRGSVPQWKLLGLELGKPLYMKLPAPALAAVDAGMNRRAAAGRFGVGVSSVIRWDAARRATGDFAPKAQGGDMRSRRLEARVAEVMTAFEDERDQTQLELCERLAARGISTSKSALSRFFLRRGITRKRREAARVQCGLATRLSRTARTS